jgi:peptidoglycan/xylan/chitin deacetylase (PgdA/CDA1 family)
MPFGALARGVFLVSIDTELAWGAAHRRRDGEAAVAARQRGYEREREVIDQVLDLFDRYGIPGTWAMVGHLLLDGCDRGPDGRPHPDQPRPEYDWLGGDWYAVDPCSDAAADPTWYAPDVVERITACATPQEVASHGFTHMIAGDPGCSREAFAAELAASHVAAVPHGLALRSFVYPRNQVAHVDALPDAGFSAYRGGRSTAPFAAVPAGWRRRVATVVDRVRPLAGSAVRPAREPSGIWNLPQTYYFAPATARRRTPPALWARPARARLRQAVRHRSVFHLWFHPADVTADPPRALACLDRICAAAARHRDRGALDTLTMAQLADTLGSGSVTTRSDAATSDAAAPRS